MAHKSGLHLVKIEGFSENFTRKLADLYINTAEEFVAIASTDEGKTRLSGYLAVDATGLEKLIDLAKNALPDSVRKEMETPVDTRNYGLGAIVEPKTGKKTSENE